MQLKRQCQYVPVDLHFNERVKDLDKFVNVNRLKKDLAWNASFNMIWKIKVQNQSKSDYHDISKELSLALYSRLSVEVASPLEACL